jgi:hypothetical protein
MAARMTAWVLLVTDGDFQETRPGWALHGVPLPGLRFIGWAGEREVFRTRLTDAGRAALVLLGEELIPSAWDGSAGSEEADRRAAGVTRVLD